MQLRPSKTNPNPTKILPNNEPPNTKNRNHNHGRNLPRLPQRIPKKIHQTMLRRTQRLNLKNIRRSKTNQPNRKTSLRRPLHRNPPRPLHTNPHQRHTLLRSNKSRTRSPSNRRQNLQTRKPRTHCPRCHQRNPKTKTGRLQNRLPHHARNTRIQSKKRHPNVQKIIQIPRLQTRPNQNLPMPSPQRLRTRKPILPRRIHTPRQTNNNKPNNTNASPHTTLRQNHANHERNPATLPNRRNKKYRYATRHRKKPHKN